MDQNTSGSHLPPGALIGAVDAGSNAIRFGIYRLNKALAPLLVFQKRYPVRLGSGTFSTGSLSDSDMDAAIEAFRDISQIAADKNVLSTVAVATSAIREAANSVDFLARVHRETGIKLIAISGDEEASLVALGIVLPKSLKRERLVIDVGGGSTEIIRYKPGTPHIFSGSLPLGAVRLAQVAGMPAFYEQSEVARLKARIIHEIMSLVPESEAAGDFYGISVGGTGRALIQSAVHIGLQASSVVLTLDTATRLTELLASTPVKDISSQFGIDSTRSGIIVPGALIFTGLMLYFGLKEIRISDTSVREGLIRQYVLERL